MVAVATRAHDVNARHAGTDRYHVLAHRAHHPRHLLPRLALGLEQHQERSRLARIGALDDGLHARAGLLSCQAVLLQQRVEQLLHLRWHGSRAHVRTERELARRARSVAARRRQMKRTFRISDFVVGK